MKMGIFDSGIGGLTVMKEIIKQLPSYDYVYLADNARVPYGGRPDKEIFQFTLEALDFLSSKNCSLMIIACNTSTTISLRTIQQQSMQSRYPGKKILGVTRAVMEATLEKNPKKIGVIATLATVQSKSFPIELQKLGATVPILQQACPKLVPAIEAGADEKELIPLIHEYINPLIEQGIDTLILGCTHYAVVKDLIQKIVGNEITIVAEGSETALKLKDYLQRHPEIEHNLSRNTSREYYATGEQTHYSILFQKILNQPIELIHCQI